MNAMIPLFLSASSDAGVFIYFRSRPVLQQQLGLFPSLSELHENIRTGFKAGFFYLLHFPKMAC